MRFIHIADTHLDMKFTKDIGRFGEKRRLDQVKAMKKMVDFAKQYNVDYIFIAGDFYEDKYIRQSTIKTINKYFETIPNTKIYITPGNHDPYIKNSIYDIVTFPDNVYIFKDFKVIEEKDANIYGMGFTDFEQSPLDVRGINVRRNGKKNILVVHGDIYGAVQDSKYNAMKIADIRDKKFDYVALRTYSCI